MGGMGQKKQKQDEAIEGIVVAQPVEQMIPASQMQALVTAAVQTALSSQQPARHATNAEADIRLVLRTADFLLRASGVKLRGDAVMRGDGAFYSDPTMVEGLRLLQSMMVQYGVTPEPVEYRRRAESPETWVDENGREHRTPHADPYGEEWMLDQLEGGWGRR